MCSHLTRCRSNFRECRTNLPALFNPCFPVQAVLKRVLITPRCARSRRAALPCTGGNLQELRGSLQFFLVLQRNSRTPVHRPSSLPALREPHTRAGRRIVAPRGWRGPMHDRLGAGKTSPGSRLGRHATKSCKFLKATDQCFFRCLNKDCIRRGGHPEKPPVQPARRHRPHHLRYLQPRALGRKVSDEFAVPLCRSHHRAVHRAGDEQAWWKAAGIEPIKSQNGISPRGRFLKPLIAMRGNHWRLDLGPDPRWRKLTRLTLHRIRPASARRREKRTGNLDCPIRQDISAGSSAATSSKISPKLEKLAINKPFECRSAVVLSPSLRPMHEGYIRCSAGPPSMRQRGKPLVRNWRKHGNRRYYRRTAQRKQLC